MLEGFERNVGDGFDRTSSLGGYASPGGTPSMLAPVGEALIITKAEAVTTETPPDWPGEGPIDLVVHDLPHASSTTEWWYLKTHVETIDGRPLSLFAAFFRALKGRDEKTGELQYAHSLTWALSDPTRKRYVNQSLVDQAAPTMGIERIDRGEGTKDLRLRRAMREVCAKGKVPFPDRMFEEQPFVATDRLDLDFDGCTCRRNDDGSYSLELWNKHEQVGASLRFEPKIAAVRHGDNGVVKGSTGEDMFYYFIPSCEVTGDVRFEGARVPVKPSPGWYDHEFGRHPAGDMGQIERGDLAWNWCGLQLENGSQISAYRIVDNETGAEVGERVLVVDKDGNRHDYPNISFEPTKSWRSTRSFNDYPTHWKMVVPEAGIDLTLEATFVDQEFVTVISKPAFWEGRVDVKGTAFGAAVEGIGFVERSGFGSVDDLEQFFGAVGEEVRRSVAKLYPSNPTYEEARNLIASEERDGLMEGVDVDRFARTLIDPVREITDRGGKSWRSYAALACCDIVGGDSRDFVQWLAMPEFMHVGSLIVDDVQDRSDVRRGGPTCHKIYGEAHAINAGTAAYFMGQKLLHSDKLSSKDQLRLYDLYFEALREGHAGQALDIEGFDDIMDAAVAAGDGVSLEKRIIAIHRLKTGAPAAALARMGAVAGGGTEAQIEGLGGFFDGLGLAFQIIDDVLNLRGFKKGLKARGEDITHGKVTLPVAKAISKLGLEDRTWLWETVKSKPSDPQIVAKAIELIESCGALDECVTQSQQLVEDAWSAFDPLVEDSLPKIILRAFGWYVLERHY